MEKVDRMIAAGLLMIAGNPEPPKWNEANPKAERYLKAWKQRMGN
jgi:GTP cyclohydrolase II